MLDDRSYLINRLTSKHVSIDEFNFDRLTAPPLAMFLSPYDINELHSIATSLRLSSKPEIRYNEIDRVMRSKGMRKFGAGTNRVVYSHPEFPNILFKVAADDVGIRDNPAEFQNQFFLKPFVCKCFEISPCGTVGIFERVNPITSREEYLSIADDVFELLTEWVIGEYVVADCGTKFFMNIGVRPGFGVVLLDFPYIYRLDGNKLFCSKKDPTSISGQCDGIIDYDDGYNFLVCTKCGAVYKAKELEAKIEANEIIMKKEGEKKMKITISGGSNNIEKYTVGESTNKFKAQKEKVSFSNNNRGSIATSNIIRNEKKAEKNSIYGVMNEEPKKEEISKLNKVDEKPVVKVVDKTPVSVTPKTVNGVSHEEIIEEKEAYTGMIGIPDGKTIEGLKEMMTEEEREKLEKEREALMAAKKFADEESKQVDEDNDQVDEDNDNDSEEKEEPIVEKDLEETKMEEVPKVVEEEKKVTSPLSFSEEYKAECIAKANNDNNVKYKSISPVQQIDIYIDSIKEIINDENAIDIFEVKLDVFRKILNIGKEFITNDIENNKKIVEALIETVDDIIPEDDIEITNSKALTLLFSRLFEPKVVAKGYDIEDDQIIVDYDINVCPVAANYNETSDDKKVLYVVDDLSLVIDGVIDTIKDRLKNEKEVENGSEPAAAEVVEEKEESKNITSLGYYEAKLVDIQEIIPTEQPSSILALTEPDGSYMVKNGQIVAIYKVNDKSINAIEIVSKTWYNETLKMIDLVNEEKEKEQELSNMILGNLQNPEKAVEEVEEDYRDPEKTEV